MRALLPALAITLLAATPRVAAAAENTCVVCHAAFPDEIGAPVEAMKNDLHAKAGLSCADCHGGDPADPDMSSMDEANGYIGAPEPAEIPGFCGRCHASEEYIRRFDPGLATDQLSQYETSIHGQLLAGGVTKAATCVSCHGSHGMLPGSDARSPVYKMNVVNTCGRCHANPEYMAEFKVGTGQTLDYRRSVHAERLLVKRDTAAPACNDCHGNHGAYPPGAQSVAEVCGQCHVAMKELFVASPHKAAFERSRLPQCVTCHGNHEIHPADDSLLGTGDVATCVGCHLPDSKGYAAATAMRAAVDELVREIDEAEAVLAEAAELGMEVSEAEFEFQGARANLVETRTLVHAFDADTLEASAAQGLEVARNAKQAGRAAIAELGSRQLMALLPLGLIGLVAALLYAKIRAVDRDQPPDDTGS